MPRYLFVDQLLGREPFSSSVAPLLAHALVQAFGEGLGETVRERFGHDGVVVVVIGFELLDEFLEADARW